MSKQDEGLIEFVESAPRRVPRWLRFVVLSFFAFVLVGTAVIDRVHPRERAMPKGQELRAEQKRRSRAKFADGTLAKLIESDLEQTSRVRPFASRPYKLLLYRYLDEAGGDLVLTGKDGWLFVRTRVFAPQHRDEEILNVWALQLGALSRGLEQLGMRVVFLPLPRRAVVAAEYLPTGVDAREGIDRQAAHALRVRGLEAVDLFPNYMDYADSPLFYRADAHWNEVAERITAEETLRQLDLLAPIESRRSSLEPDVFETQGMQGDLNRDLYWLVGIDPPQGSEMLRGADLPANNVLDHKQRHLWNHHNPKKMPKIALTGTSFSARRAFSLLLEHFGRFRIHDASAPALGPIVPITQFLENQKEALPELLLVEMPIFTAFQRQQFGVQIAELLSANPPEGLVPFGPVTLSHPLGENRFGYEQIATKKNGFLVRTMAGALLSTWDNLFGVRVRGEVLEGTVDLRLLIDGYSVTDQWSEGENESYFALLAPNKGGSLFPIFSSSKLGDAKFKLNSAEFVTSAQLDEAVALKPARQGNDENGWFVEFELDRSALPLLAGPRECAVVVRNWQSSSERPFDGCRIVVNSKDDSRRLVQGKIATGGWVFASLGDAGREAPAVLRFSGPDNSADGQGGLPLIRAKLAPLGLLDPSTRQTREAR